ncbi:hypothetical protein VIGAN_05159700 [Vigna angularis var. angularis]|uniref:Uncharacterized protein n=1 Tax=Vigna angularis var. angularis TaxID=157739 RepID=A0A0S3S5N2_PHAAN|nr:hypothetical protein VIGAN_05159700 [Vigna angularis var. angularis]
MLVNSFKSSKVRGSSFFSLKYFCLANSSNELTLFSSSRLYESYCSSGYSSNLIIDSKECFHPEHFKRRAATSRTAVLVGAHVNVLTFNSSRENNKEATVFVLPVPGGPQISLTVSLCWHSLEVTQFKTASFWDSFRF